MNELAQLVIIGIASNLDNLGVGIAYGIRRIRVPAMSNFIIAVIAFVFSTFGVLAGNFAGRFLADALAGIVGAVMIAGIGVVVILQSLRARKAAKAKSLSVRSILREPEIADVDHSGVISLRESLLLGVALSINCVTNAIPAGLWHLGVLPVSLSNAVFSFATIWLGTELGHRYGSCWLGDHGGVVAGCLLILLGLHQLFG